MVYSSQIYSGRAIDKITRPHFVKFAVWVVKPLLPWHVNAVSKERMERNESKGGQFSRRPVSSILWLPHIAPQIKPRNLHCVYISQIEIWLNPYFTINCFRVLFSILVFLLFASPVPMIEVHPIFCCEKKRKSSLYFTIVELS